MPATLKVTHKAIGAEVRRAARRLGRLLENLGRALGPYGTPMVDPAEENRYRSETEEFLAGPRRPVESWSAARYCSTILLLRLYL